MTDPRSKRRRRVIRWAVFAVAAGALWIGVLRRFSLVEIDVATAEAMLPAMRPGHRHLVDRSPPFALVRGWIVWWRLDDDPGALFSRVAACPGDVVGRAGGRWRVEPPAGTGSVLRPELRLPATWDGRALAPGEYLLLNDRLDAPWPDSRRVGPVRREQVVARVLFAFGGGAR